MTGRDRELISPPSSLAIHHDSGGSKAGARLFSSQTATTGW
jgi:hypothetical protein